MNRLDLITRARSMLRDFSTATFRQVDIENYINEGIDRMKQVITEFQTMGYLTKDDDIPAFIPSQYQHLLSLYASSRCFAQDERHYQAGNYMNEFENKLEQLQTKIQSGEIIIIDPVTNKEVETPWFEDYVVDNYFNKR